MLLFSTVFKKQSDPLGTSKFAIHFIRNSLAVPHEWQQMNRLQTALTPLASFHLRPRGSRTSQPWAGTAARRQDRTPARPRAWPAVTRLGLPGGAAGRERGGMALREGGAMGLLALLLASLAAGSGNGNSAKPTEALNGDGSRGEADAGAMGTLAGPGARNPRHLRPVPRLPGRCRDPISPQPACP